MSRVAWPLTELSQGQAARLLPTTFRTQPADPRAGSRSTSSLPNYGGVHSLIPVKDTNCGLPGALSLTDTAPRLKEFIGGIHLTVMVQDFPAPRFVSQLFVSEKAAPVIPMPVMLNVVLPKLVSVGVASVWHTHPSPIIFLQAKIRLVGDRVAFGPETTPVPFKAIPCGFPAALSVMVTAAVRGPI